MVRVTSGEAGRRGPLCAGAVGSGFCPCAADRALCAARLARGCVESGSYCARHRVRRRRRTGSGGLFRRAARRTRHGSHECAIPVGSGGARRAHCEREPAPRTSPGCVQLGAAFRCEERAHGALRRPQRPPLWAGTRRSSQAATTASTGRYAISVTSTCSRRSARGAPAMHRQSDADVIAPDESGLDHVHVSVRLGRQGRSVAPSSETVSRSAVEAASGERRAVMDVLFVYTDAARRIAGNMDTRIPHAPRPAPQAIPEWIWIVFRHPRTRTSTRYMRCGVPTKCKLSCYWSQRAGLATTAEESPSCPAPRSIGGRGCSW